MEIKSDSHLLPQLIYDGNCGFCVYWVKYWQKLTNDKVLYQPYQEVAAQHPTISLEEFQRAVQYIAPDGKISSAAEASFLTLSHAPYKSFWLWLYRYFPGFAFLSEWIYAFIASHRESFLKISLFLWGKNYVPPRFEFIAGLFLRILGIIFLVAFVSFGSQALGLIGSHGIIPISELIQSAENQLDFKRYWLLPMLFWFNSSDFFIQAICWGGVGFSLLLIFHILPRISLLVLYLFYLSLFYAGNVFMSFQWDLYLLETSIIAFFLVSYTWLGIYLLRWLLFRFILVGGLVKILSGDSTWRDLSALNYYFFTQPLPTPLAWYANQLPQSILSFSVAATLFIELIISFFIFFPRRLRFFSAIIFIIFQALILITGNYNFFNILTIALCLVLLDDAVLEKKIPQRLKNSISLKISTMPRKKIISVFVGFFAGFTILVSLIQFYLRFVGNAPTPVVWMSESIAPWRIVNTYGPFAVMTTERNEIIVEGSEDGITWKEYEFKYKPGDIYQPPRWNIPFQPRLDWQMWFAALSTSDQTPWFYRFIRKILENSNDVLSLLEKNPFPDKPPIFVRAKFYNYRFTTKEEKDASHAWWQRKLISDYLPAVRLS